MCMVTIIKTFFKYFVIVVTNIQKVWHVDKSTWGNLTAYTNVVF
jgi:hypothetical protein